MSAIVKHSDPVSVNYPRVHWPRTANLRKSIEGMGEPLSDLEWKEVTKDGVTFVQGLTKDGLVHSLATKAWDVKQGVITVTRATKEEQAAAIAERREIIEEYKADENLSSFAYTMEAVWFPGGKPEQVDWIANNCWRRSIAIRGVLRNRRRDAGKGKPFDTTFKVVIAERSFAGGMEGRLEKLIDHYDENGMKNTGRKELAPTDLFFIAKEYIGIKGAAATEAEMMRTFPSMKRGAAQRAFALAKLDANYPKLKLAERVLRPVAKPYIGDGTGGLSVEKVSHADVVRINKGYLPGTTEDTEENEMPSVKDERQETIESYFTKVMTGTADKALSSRQITDALKASSITLLSVIGKEAGKQNGNFAKMFDDKADEINAALSFLFPKPKKENVKK